MTDLPISLADYHQIYDNLDLDIWQDEKITKFVNFLKKGSKHSEFVVKPKIYFNIVNNTVGNVELKKFAINCIKNHEDDIYKWISNLVLIYNISPYECSLKSLISNTLFSEFTIFGKCEINNEIAVNYNEYSGKELMQSIKQNFARIINPYIRPNVLKSDLSEKIKQLSELEKLGTVSLFQLENKVSEILELQIFLLDDQYSIDNKNYNKNFLVNFLKNKKFQLPKII